jgi:hypothetical protein
LADFYALDAVWEDDAESTQHTHLVQHVLFKAMRVMIISRMLFDCDVLRPIADLPALYKVFERC